MHLKSPALKRGLLLIGSTFMALALVEGAARAYLAFVPPMSSLRRWVPGTPPPPPYRDAPYFTREFVEEFKAIDEGPASFSGTYFHVVNGTRTTTDSPESARHRVWLFGGSTMFSAEVPDSETIASHLQRLLNRQPDTHQVSNQGLTAETIPGATERLLTMNIGVGDVVVFYGGVNDVSRYVYSAASGHWMLDRIGVALERVRPVSAASQLVADAGTRTSPAAVRDAARLSRNIERMTVQYEQSLRKASAYVHARGARFHHVLQPQIFSKARWSAYERELSRNHRDVPAGLDVAFRAAYPALQATLKPLEKRGVMNVDLTGAFDDLPPGAEIYFDFCHANHTANAIVARRLYEAIWTPAASRR